MPDGAAGGPPVGIRSTIRRPYTRNLTHTYMYAYRQQGSFSSARGADGDNAATPRDRRRHSARRCPERLGRGAGSTEQDLPGPDAACARTEIPG